MNWTGQLPIGLSYDPLDCLSGMRSLFTSFARSLTSEHPGRQGSSDGWLRIVSSQLAVLQHDAGDEMMHELALLPIA